MLPLLEREVDDDIEDWEEIDINVRGGDGGRKVTEGEPELERIGRSCSSCVIESIRVGIESTSLLPRTKPSR